MKKYYRILNEIDLFSLRIVVDDCLTYDKFYMGVITDYPMFVFDIIKTIDDMGIRKIENNIKEIEYIKDKRLKIKFKNDSIIDVLTPKDSYGHIFHYVITDMDTFNNSDKFPTIIEYKGEK